MHSCKFKVEVSLQHTGTYYKMYLWPYQEICRGLMCLSLSFGKFPNTQVGKLMYPTVSFSADGKTDLQHLQFSDEGI